MSDFTYPISGKEYTVPDSLLSQAVEGINEGDSHSSRDDLRVRAAKDAFFSAINAQMHYGESRSDCHYLTIDGIRVWEEHWKTGTKGDFNLENLYEDLWSHLTRLGLIKTPWD